MRWVVIFVILLISTNLCLANDNLIVSATEIRDRWTNYFSDYRGPYVKTLELPLGVCFFGFKYKIPNSERISFDIIKTNSIMSPYRLILLVNFDRRETGNMGSWKAAQNSKPKDFTLRSDIKCVFYYEMKDGHWVAAEGNEKGNEFLRILSLNLSKEEIYRIDELFGNKIPN